MKQYVAFSENDHRSKESTHELDRELRKQPGPYDGVGPGKEEDLSISCMYSKCISSAIST